LADIFQRSKEGQDKTRIHVFLIIVGDDLILLISFGNILSVAIVWKITTLRKQAYSLIINLHSS